MALNKGEGKTVPCNHRNCQCCNIVSDKSEFRINGKTIRPASGNCCTYNIIYVLQCQLCNKNYVGRSVRELHTRVGEHRRNYYKILGDLNSILCNNLYRDDDDYSAGFHLIDAHNSCSKSDFSKHYRVFILDTCSPSNIEVLEHKYIHSLRTLQPHGINTMNPFAIPLLYD